MNVMRTKRFFLLVIFCGMTMCLSAQGILGQILNGITQGLSQGVELNMLQKVIDNPSLQSADMQKFLSSYRKGVECHNNQNYYDAAQNFAGAYLIATNTNDQYLIKLWNNYGWYKDVKDKVVSNCALAGIPNPFIQNGFSGGTVNYSSGKTGTGSSSSRVCNLCHGTGLKVKEYYGAGQRTYCDKCNKNVSVGHKHVVCDLCGGSGKLNY